MAFALWCVSSLAGAFLVTRLWYSSRPERIALGVGIAGSCLAGFLLAELPEGAPRVGLVSFAALGAAIPVAAWALVMAWAARSRPFPPATIALGGCAVVAVLAIPNLVAMRRATRGEADPVATVEPGFVSLDDLSHWHLFRGTGHRGWESRHGEIVRVSAGGDLASNDAWGDFELRFEWKISRGGNSGVMYRVSERAEKPWQSGPEFQILDDAGHADGKDPLTSAGALYGLVAPAGKTLGPVGTWNDAAILVDGDSITHVLNGHAVVRTTLASLRPAIAASKFAPFSGFAAEREGLLVLQDHGDEVAFRHLRIRAKPKAPAITPALVHSNGR
ncbi:MAG TPA: DUF1080 domain-containing protein [bacterium]|nr:DUF1080 domain-containing protein [bacterium]